MTNSTITDFFFFNDTATTEIYTLSLHDALPIWAKIGAKVILSRVPAPYGVWRRLGIFRDRKSTRLNSSHLVISYAVFCLKKKKRNSRLRGRLRLPGGTATIVGEDGQLARALVYA